ncbi:MULTISPECIES: hypothetical protein [Cellulophaga]|uniref:Membrane metalloprotease n=1 Tax=Cellulophaga baltica 18 TaxID=1348584 RepID=A0AAU8RIK6_9FLAO|nr:MULTISPECIES: hypothetical protein [Cellulophaga]AIY11866.1 hypothetical protein M667_00780 [Cellulophaga baltica NN016038]AIZ40231.1 hypothetical protein M666_00755 [Cellulophaga baltica 18]KGK29349.1 hypothetical protein EL45_15625 [Cellulophaga sp. E6(2014)]
MKKSFPVVLLLALLVFVNCSKSTSTDTESSGSTDPNVTINKVPNLQGTGDSANDFLSNANFDKLLIEIGYVTGFKPDETAIDDFIEFIKETTFKETVEIQYLELSSSGKENLSINEVDEIIQEERTAYNTDDTLALFIYFSDAPSDEDEPEEDLVTLGAAFRNTSLVIYESTIIDLANKSFRVDVATVETATLHHELGHLLGLVNIGTEMVNDHEGTFTNEDGVETPSQHCNQDGCLMRAELEFGAAMKEAITAKNGQVPELDVECLRDLKANGGR